MSTLAWWLIKAQFKTRRTATLLSMLAIALGVTLGYAIHLINDAALSDFSRAMKSVQGEPDAVIAPRDSAGNVSLALLNQLATDPNIAVMAPVIETRVRIAAGARQLAGTIRFLGLDVFTAPALMPDMQPRQQAPETVSSLFNGGVFASPALLKELKLKAGDSITLSRADVQWQAVIAGDVPAARQNDRLLIADIAWVQAKFGPVDAVDELRIALTPNADPQSWRTQTAERLPASLLIKAAADEGARVSNLSRAYRVNLNVLALVALLTGVFLVFATQLTAVAQRSTQFALLGVLGLSPRLRMAQVLLEGLAVGVPGAVIGLVLGYGLAVIFTRVLGGDLGGGYFSDSAPLIVPKLMPMLTFFALGCVASLAGGLYPAYLNRMQPLAQALKTGFAATQKSLGKYYRFRRLVLLLALAGLAAGLTQLPAIDELPVAGYAAIAVVLILGVASTPLLTQALFEKLAGQRLPPAQKIAVQNLAQAPLMAQVAASGLIVSFALTASMVIMVSSFRVAVDQWLEEVLPAPLYLRSKSTPLPQTMLTSLEQVQTLFEKTERAASSSITLDPQRPAIMLTVRELDRNNPAARLPFTGPVVSAPAGVVTIWISEPMQELYQLKPGQMMSLPILGKTVPVFVGGVWRDYVRQFGSAVIAASDYSALGAKFEPSDLALWPRAGQEKAARAWLTDMVQQHGLELAESAQIRTLSLSIFDKSFAVTYALEAAAMLIGLFGLAVTLAASVWLRARELATLSALGFDRCMLTHAVMFEGALIAAVGLAIGMVCGIVVGAILTHVINPQAFHWRMQLTIPWAAVLGGAGLTLLAGVAASRLAARQATRLPAAQVLASAQ